jgi:tetratricopeptide (TPR) repeat protein
VSKSKPAANKATPEKTGNTAEDDADEAEEVELVLTLPLSGRVAKLKEFLATYPNSKSRPRAFELLVSTYAGLGDLKLKNGDIQGGVEELMMAIGETPANTTDALFSGVIAQIPANLYLRGVNVRRLTRQRRKSRRSLEQILSAYWFSPGFIWESRTGWKRRALRRKAVKLAPDAADSHRALALGLHLSLRLDEAAAEYKRALELDPNSKKATRRNLADLSRGAGKTESALLLYQQQLLVDPADRSARAGVVLSLFELGRD